MKEGGLGKYKSMLKKAFVIIFIAFVAFSVLICWSKACSVDRLLINDRIVSKNITDETGIYTLDLSDISDTEQYSLHFKSYGNAITVTADGNQIYYYGADASRHTMDVGRIYVSVILPENVQNLEIRLEKSDANASLELVKIDLCDINDMGRYYLTNDTLGLPMALIYWVVGLVTLLAAVVLCPRRRLACSLLFFSLTLLCMGIELSDTGGHYLVFLQDQYSWNIAFYFASYILPVSATLYCYTLIGDRFPKRYKRIAMIGVWLNISFGVICTILSFATDYCFSDFAGLYKYNMFICMAFASFAAIILLIKKVIIEAIIPVLFGIGFWGLTALIITILNRPLVNTGAGIRLDIESVQSILLLIVLGGAFLTFLVKELEKIEEERLRVMRLEEESRNLRYKVFTSQMQPHFLYNALSSIQQIVYEDQEYAASLLRSFTIHLRATIRALSDDKQIPFRDELRNIEAYIEIEQMRFGDRLSIQYDIQADDFTIVPLCIQPLVENAVKHGIYNRGDEGGTVTIRSRETDAAWVIEVQDNGVGFSVKDVLHPKEETDSTGLRNIIYRLENYMDATVEIESTIDVGTHITIKLPKVGNEKE